MRVGMAIGTPIEREASPFLHRGRTATHGMALFTRDPGVSPRQGEPRFRVIDLLRGFPIVGTMASLAVGPKRALVFVFVATGATASKPQESPVLILDLNQRRNLLLNPLGVVAFRAGQRRMLPG